MEYKHPAKCLLCQNEVISGHNWSYWGLVGRGCDNTHIEHHSFDKDEVETSSGSI